MFCIQRHVAGLGGRASQAEINHFPPLVIADYDLIARPGCPIHEITHTAEQV
jgi:hypothetical protein